MFTMCTHSSKVHTMRTNVVIDDMVRVATFKATGVRTKREAVGR